MIYEDLFHSARVQETYFTHGASPHSWNNYYMSSSIDLDGVYYRTELHRHDSEFPVLKVKQWRSVLTVCESSFWVLWLELITTMHSNTKRSPWKSERESFFFWIVPFMACCLYVWMTITRAVTCISAVDKWFAMYPSVFIVFLVHIFLFFAFIVTIQ